MIDITHSITMAKMKVAPEPDHYSPRPMQCNKNQFTMLLMQHYQMQWQYECEIYKSMLFHDAIIN